MNYWSSPDERIRLFCGDCLEIIPTLADKSIDCVLTDPPYDLSISLGDKGIFKGDSPMAYRKLTSGVIGTCGAFDAKLAFESWERLLRVISVFVFCSNKQISKTMTAAENKGWTTTLLVWNKYNSVPFCHNTWRQDAEFVVHARKRGAPINGNAELKRKVKRLPLQHSRHGHPTEKPLALVRDYVEIGSNAEDVVFDPYMGSGTTGVACIETGRRFFGIEKNPEYFKIAVDRISRTLP